MPDIEWIEKAGLYRDPKTNRIIPRGEMVIEVEKRIKQVEIKFQALGRQLLAKKIPVLRFQKMLTQQLKAATWDIATYAVGGEDNLTSNQVNNLNLGFEEQYQRILKMGDDYASGSISPKQLKARLHLYAKSVRVAYFTLDHESRQKAGYSEAWRYLGGHDDHCDRCLSHATNGWERIEKVVPIGKDCDCRANCRCKIRYRRTFDLSRLTGGVLTTSQH